MRRFEGKVVLVIGGGTGMGRATADSFADEGATVVVSEIPPALGRQAVVGIDAAVRGQEAVDGINARGGKAFLVHCNIGKRNEVKAMIDEAARLAGGIDILVLSASYNPKGTILEMPDETYDELVRCNISSIFWIAKDAAPYLSKAKDKGRLIYISSGAANRQFLPGFIPYGAGKAYMNAFARGLAVEFGPLNILVNTVEPGLTATDRLKSKMPMDFINAAAANFPVPRAGQPQDIANAILFLASAEASYITGASLLVDGGASMASLTAVTDKASH